MKLVPFLVFLACAAISSYAAVGLITPHDPAAAPLTPYRLLPDMLGFMLVFFGLASVLLPIVIALNVRSGENS
jgi:hypothetical protein